MTQIQLSKEETLKFKETLTQEIDQEKMSKIYSLKAQQQKYSQVLIRMIEFIWELKDEINKERVNVREMQNYYLSDFEKVKAEVILQLESLEKKRTYLQLQNNRLKKDLDYSNQMRKELEQQLLQGNSPFKFSNAKSHKSFDLDNVVSTANAMKQGILNEQ